MARNRTVLALGATLAALATALAAPAAAAAGGHPAARKPTAGSLRDEAVRVHRHIGPTAVAGYAWSGDTSGYYTYDGTGHTATVEGDGTGSYFVIFPGLQKLANEHVDVTT